GHRRARRPGTRGRLRAGRPDPAPVYGRRQPTLADHPVVGVAIAAGWAAGVRLRVVSAGDSRNAGPHRRRTDPGRGGPRQPAVAGTGRLAGAPPRGLGGVAAGPAAEERPLAELGA